MDQIIHLGNSEISVISPSSSFSDFIKRIKEEISLGTLESGKHTDYSRYTDQPSHDHCADTIAPK